MKKYNSRLDRLKVKGMPAPRNTPVSPFLDTAMANKPIGGGFITFNNSYEFILNQANRHTVEMLPPGNTSVKGRMEFLNRVQHANFGISTMDSPYITSEGTIVEDKPRFVLCGKPVKGYTPKSLDKYLSDQRVGSFKTSAQETYRARHNVRAKALSEPATGGLLTEEHLLVGSDANSVKEDGRDDKSMVSYITVPASSESVSLPVMRSGSHKAVSSYEPKVKDENPKISIPSKIDIGRNSNLVIQRPKTHNQLSSRQIKTNNKSLTKSASDIGANTRVTYSVPSITSTNDGSKSAKYARSFMKRGIRNFNNPYRLLKNRERQIVIRTQNLDMKTVEKITHLGNNQIENMRRDDNVLIKLPRGSADTFLLDMILDLNTPKGRMSSSKYSDIALHRDLDEYMVVRSPSSQSKSPTKSLRGKSVKSNMDEESLWAGNDVDEELVKVDEPRRKQ